MFVAVLCVANQSRSVHYVGSQLCKSVVFSGVHKHSSFSMGFSEIFWNDVIINVNHLLTSYITHTLRNDLLIIIENKRTKTIVVYK